MCPQLLYDQIPYSSFPHAQSHPDQLATVAFLHGLDPSPTAACRVLELGCGSGANLLGIAHALPAAHCVGVDLARTAVADANRTASTLELSNAEFLVCDVRDLADRPLGEFDYVIAHGLYAWVDSSTRDALIAACVSHLAERGLAFVSFNTHPGGHFRRSLRELALWYARRAEGPAERARLAHELFTGLRELRTDADPWGALLADELTGLSQAGTDLLVHDLLGEDWEPVWFADFAEAAATHGLRYVGEASFHRFTGPWEAEAEQALWRLAAGDRIAYHQIGDFLVWRRFRDSLLCRAQHDVSVHADPERLKYLRFRLAGPLGGFGSAPDALFAALDARAPGPVPFEELHTDLEIEPERLIAELLGAAISGRVTMHLDPPALGDADVERPRVTALARLQADGGTYCTTRLGGVVKVEGSVVRTLLRLTDGSRDRDQIRNDLAATGAPMLDPASLDAALRDFAAMGLLEPA